MEQYSGFTYEVMEGKGIRILSIDKHEEYVSVPAYIQDLPVLELGAYALEDSCVREIHLPEFLQRIGRYAFYNCERLERLQLYGSLKDVGTGAFTGVHRVHQIHLTLNGEEEKLTVLQELLSDFAETIQVTLFYDLGPGRQREIRLLFPEYYEQGVENTPARIIVNQFFGTGMKYRNCFTGRQLVYEEYDKLFPLAAAGERRELVQELALTRLQWPWKLSDGHRQVYLDWLAEHSREILKDLIRDRNLDRIRFLLEHAAIPKEIQDESALYCSQQGFAAAVPLFMMRRDAANAKVEEVGLEEEAKVTEAKLETEAELAEAGIEAEKVGSETGTTVEAPVPEEASVSDNSRAGFVIASSFDLDEI
ncbi:MAG: leucine-rich repeat protein [Lachnospiraceae bacterium]|nr:leucine-rich repeat protein [Lachnospiraceae bacterium]